MCCSDQVAVGISPPLYIVILVYSHKLRVAPFLFCSDQVALVGLGLSTLPPPPA